MHEVVDGSARARPGIPSERSDAMRSPRLLAAGVSTARCDGALHGHAAVRTVGLLGRCRLEPRMDSRSGAALDGAPRFPGQAAAAEDRGGLPPVPADAAACGIAARAPIGGVPQCGRELGVLVTRRGAPFSQRNIQRSALHLAADAAGLRVDGARLRFHEYADVRVMPMSLRRGCSERFRGREVGIIRALRGTRGACRWGGSGRVWR